MIATSWSDNERKGADTLAWLDAHLDFDRYELTFVGRAPVSFERIDVVGPVGSHEVARLLGEHDVYLAPSRDDPCSNALLEALACGLPAAYLESGGHPELVGEGGLPFPRGRGAAGRARPARRRARRAALGDRVPSLADVADRYLAVLGVERPA